MTGKSKRVNKLQINKPDVNNISELHLKKITAIYLFGQVKGTESAYDTL